MCLSAFHLTGPSQGLAHTTLPWPAKCPCPSLQGSNPEGTPDLRGKKQQVPEKSCFRFIAGGWFSWPFSDCAFRTSLQRPARFGTRPMNDIEVLGAKRKIKAIKVRHGSRFLHESRIMGGKALPDFCLEGIPVQQYYFIASPENSSFRSQEKTAEGSK